MNTASATWTNEAASEARVRDYVALLKPKVMSLVVFTGLAGLWIAPGASQIHPMIAFTAILCLALGAGAAGAINMWYDRDIDAEMKRTKNRPIPLGRVAPDEALAFGLVLSVFSVMTMALAVNWMAAGLLAFANAFYVVIYTMWLKRRTPQNIVIGGAAGAFPPVIGWAAVTGDIGLVSLSLFALIFFWTPPHFWALSLFANSDYKAANIPMMTVTAGKQATKWQMLVYSLLLVPLSVVPYALGAAGLWYGITAFILSVFFVFTNMKVLKEDSENGDNRAAKAMFGYSVFYLFAIFLALMIWPA